MMRKGCGCTAQGPGPECTEGREHYAAALRAFQDLFKGKEAMIAHDERWIVYALARLAYIDHFNGWQEGDVKIQRRAGFGMVFTRLSGQWIFQFGTKEDALLADWLRNRGYQRYVQVKSERPGDQLLGYYRTSRGNNQRATNSELFPAQLQAPPEAPPLLNGGMTTSLEQSVARTPSSSPLDLKTRVAIRVTFLVARYIRPLTLSDRLSVQQRAARLLQGYGSGIGQSDERTLQELIDEAIWQKEHLSSLINESTGPLQE